MREAFLTLALMSAGCGIWGEQIECPSQETVISQTEQDRLTCGDLKSARLYVEMLAGRSLKGTQKGRLYSGFRAGHQEDAATVRKQIDQMTQWMASAGQKRGLEAAEFRSAEVWRAVSQKGPITKSSGPAWDVQVGAIAVWTRSDEQGLALTEMDIEGWIRLGSLCREVQGGSPFKMSIANREQVYRSMRTEFKSLSREDQLARVAVGPFWSQIEDRWQGATYEQQQGWIRQTPLPPPMTATSLAYMEEVLALPPAKMADALHTILGPFSLP